MKRYKFWNIVCGWVAFAIAAFTYLSTIEPTASFWDCPEFISTAFKLDVGHPPGAPFFMLLGHFFTLFAGGDVTLVAKMVNVMSALASAFTILFLFWTITMLAKKIVRPDAEGNFKPEQIIAIMGSGLVGALLFTFTDTFWFSAVEGEVYALSSLFTALVVWCALKWDEHADEAHANRWLLLIAYLMGLSIGVHLLNLLAIPAIALIVYFRKYQPTWKGTIAALLVSFVVLGLMMYGVIPGIVMVASWFELLMVNFMGLPFNSGFAFYLVLLLAALVAGVVLTQAHQKLTTSDKVMFILAMALSGIPFVAGKIWLGIILILAMIIVLFFIKKANISSVMLNTILLSVLLLVIGYSSFAVIVIRSMANPPMDQNSPENTFSLKSYLNREQYGNRPLFYGPYYNADLIWEPTGSGYYKPKTDIEGVVWSAKEKMNEDEKDTYIVTDSVKDYKYVDETCTLFPRMYSSQGSHVNAYKEWAGAPTKRVRYRMPNDPAHKNTVPSFGQNLKFFFNYQVMYMYCRYFLWNFSGRQNDQQGYGERDKGMFLTGIPFIDSTIEGDYDTLPDDMKNNKGRNVYYLLPFILGLIGISYQMSRKRAGKESLAIVGVFFFMTGLAIVLYLNQTPYQPRERDYAYAGSFYAYAIWIGLGVLGILSWFMDKVKDSRLRIASASAVSAACLLVPAQMAGQNWDDHDRSNRYVCRDFGYDYLMSCAPNAVIFTNGDNDTFPLWYLQEVEGVRTDVRVCNLSYLQTDWYIDQMRRDAYLSKALPIEWKRYQYVQGTRDICDVFADTVNIFNLEEAINTYLLNDELTEKNGGNGILPGKYCYIPVNKEKYMAENAFVKDASDLDTAMFLTLKDRLYKHEEMILEMLAKAHWERPIYYSVTVGNDMFLGMQNNFQLEGLANRIVPKRTNGGSVNTDIMYDNMMHKFKFGNLKDTTLYLDETNTRMCLTMRRMFLQLAEALEQEGKRDSVKAVLDYCEEQIPEATVAYDYASLFFARMYYRAGDTAKADRIIEKLMVRNDQYLKWYGALAPSKRGTVSENSEQHLAEMQNSLAVLEENNRKEMLEKWAAEFERHYGKFVGNRSIN